MSDRPNIELPDGWTEAELRQTGAEQFGIGSDSGLPTDTRFKINIVRLLRTRLAGGGDGDPKRISVFLLKPTPKDPSVINAVFPMLDNGLTLLSGRVWFIPTVAASGRCVDIAPHLDDDGVFDLVANVLDEPNTPAIVFDPRTAVPSARFYPAGLVECTNYEQVPLNVTTVNLNTLFGAIEKTYVDGLITPLAQGSGGKLWRNAGKVYPAKDAEAKIQYALRIGLSNALPMCTIREEQPMPEGRLDLEVEESNPLDRANITRHAILELKVLRSFNEKGVAVSEKVTRDWVKDGVVQAAEYRDNRGAKLSALCCFDMRKDDTGDTCFAHVKALAKRRAVSLKRWFIYSTSKKLRDSKAA